VKVHICKSVRSIARLIPARSIKYVALASLIVVATGAPAARALPAITDSHIEKLKTEKIKVGSREIVVEIADTSEARERGLMYRKSMPANEGMLFIFDSAQPLAFWMKNTLIPLSIGYFDANRKLLGTHEMTPAVMGEVQPKTYPSQGDAKYALEMNKGWFTQHKIKPGAQLTLPAQGPGK
jgi:uncharacterized membrane protein (UPF0127 family)